MATARRIISRALRMLGVLASGEAPSDHDAVDSLEALNAMLRSYVLSHAPGFPDLALDDALPYPSTHDEGITALLAVRLSPEYGKPTPPEVQAMATRGESLLRAYYNAAGLMQVDNGLLRQTPSTATNGITFDDLGGLS